MANQEHLSRKNIINIAIILIIVTGAITNSKNIHFQLSYLSQQEIASKSPNDETLPRPTVPNDVSDRFDCLKARRDSVPKSLHRKLPKPYINLGFPKMGTSSIYSFFRCGGYTATHFRCGKNSLKCAVCTKRSVEAGLPPLSTCGDADVYAQLDNGTYFPQIELLDEFVQGHPDATFFLTFRSMEKWFHSISHWPPRKGNPHMDDRLKMLNITGLPSGNGRNVEEFSDWYCKHVQRVRAIVAQNPSHSLVEIDIEDPATGQRLEDIFGIDKGCWGQENVNTNIHPEVNHSEVVMSRYFRKKKRIAVGTSRPNDGSVDKNNESGDNINEARKEWDEEEVETHEELNNNNQRHINPSIQDFLVAKTENNEFLKAECFKARKNSIPTSLHGKLPKPFINVGMPKIGSTSLHSFFKCGNYSSSHWECGKGKGLCAKCIRKAVTKRTPLLSSCGGFDAFMQMDDGSYYPQIENLNEIHSESPNATFLLTFRDMSGWYRSVSNWPPNRKRQMMNERIQAANITGLPPGKGANEFELSEWFCNHVQNIRDFVEKHPSHALVEIDITNPSVNEQLEELFGIRKGCWTNKNKNLMLTVGS